MREHVRYSCIQHSIGTAFSTFSSIYSMRRFKVCAQRSTIRTASSTYIAKGYRDFDLTQESMRKVKDFSDFFFKFLIYFEFIQYQNYSLTSI